MSTRWMQIPSEVRDLVGFLIIDEAHCFCTRSQVPALLAFRPKYIVAETATLERDDGLEDMIYAICGNKIICRESNQPFAVIKVLTHTKPVRKKNRRGDTDWSALVNDLAFNPRRNQIIIDLIARHLQYKILVLTALKDHTMWIYQQLQTLQINTDFLCGSKKGYQNANVLIGTVSKLGTGFDAASSCATYDGRPFDLLIMACSMKKQSMLVQNVGRVFRCDYPTVFHLVDDDSIFENHWRLAKKWYELRGGLITEWRIPVAESPPASDPEADHQAWLAAKLQAQTTGRSKLRLVKS